MKFDELEATIQILLFNVSSDIFSGVGVAKKNTIVSLFIIPANTSMIRLCPVSFCILFIILAITGFKFDYSYAESFIICKITYSKKFCQKKYEKIRKYLSNLGKFSKVGFYECIFLTLW